MKTNPNDLIHPTITQEASFLDLKGDTVQPAASSQGGLTKLEHFALNAPPMPVWFSHESPDNPEPILNKYAMREYFETDSVLAKYIDQYDFIEGQWMPASTKVPKAIREAVEAAENVYQNSIDQHVAWQNRNIQDKYFAWPLFYAKQLIQELNREGLKDERTE